MSRRNKSTEADINTDSFLDIIANIVGILIILIVVAGVRVSQAPIPGEQVEPEQEPESVAEAPAVPKFVWPDAPSVATSHNVAPEWIVEEPAPVEPEIPEPVVIDVTPDPDHELISSRLLQAEEVERLKVELARNVRHLEEIKKDLSSQADSEQQLEMKIAAQNELLLQSRAEFNSTRDERAQLKEQNQIAESRLAQLAGLVKAAERELSSKQKESEIQPGLVLRHDMTPVSEIVRRKEVHFLVRDGKVAEIPIEPLLEEIKQQIDLRKDWILRSNRHIGTVGPIRGFLMEYIVEREQLSTLDQLKIGTGVVRISLTKWILKEDPDTLVWENHEQADSSTSRFLVAVRSAPQDATCTFWVYPESFEAYQDLKSLVHKNGLRVAGRPLPEGMPVSGSPQGSRSAAQ